MSITHEKTRTPDSQPQQNWTEAGPVAVRLPAEETQQLQERKEVTVAEPAALGLFGFALTGLGLVGEPTLIGHIGGYWLILSALLAFYAAGALVINSTYRSTVLPLFGKA